MVATHLCNLYCSNFLAEILEIIRWYSMFWWKISLVIVETSGISLDREPLCRSLARVLDFFRDASYATFENYTLLYIRLVYKLLAHKYLGLGRHLKSEPQIKDFWAPSPWVATWTICDNSGGLTTWGSNSRRLHMLDIQWFFGPIIGVIFAHRSDVSVQGGPWYLSYLLIRLMISLSLGPQLT